MKKIGSLLFVLFTSAFTASAQFYLNLGLGYAIPQAAQTMYDSPIPYNGFPTGYNGTRNNNPNATSISYTYSSLKRASFSSGVQSAIGAGYMFSDYVGIQLDASIGLSATKYTFNDNNVNLNGYLCSISTIQQAKTPVLMMPALVLQSGGDKVNLYSRFGIALPLNTKVTQDQVITSAPGTGALTVDDFTWQIKNSFSLGFTAAAGVKYHISDRVSIWGELSLLSMSVFTKEQTLQNWEENGLQVALSNYTNATTIKYSKNAAVDSTLSNLPPYAQPFSNLGIKVGVTINLTDKRQHHSRRSSNEDIDDTKPFRR